MIARVAVWEPMPEDERQWVIDAAKTVPGVLDAYHLVDPKTGKAEQLDWNDEPRPTPKSETIYRVIRRG